MSDTAAPSRRNFLQTSATVGAAAVGALAVPKSVHAAGADETLRVGLVGCGGRGMGAATDALAADPLAQLVAVADAFPDKAQECVTALKADAKFAPRVMVTPERVYAGFDGYKQLIDSGVDVVLLATPPHFRPQHLAYAVEQGKHCFVEKPVAVDAPGVRAVMAACEAAKAKSLNIVSGLCYRYDLPKREVVRRIHEDKAIGDIVAIDTRYLTTGLWHRGDDPAWSRMEYQVRNWLYFTWLSGDHIMEQAIHSIDKASWLMGDAQPTRAIALGGRQQRVDPKYGNVYDHFSVLYEYPNDVRVTLSCRQQDGCASETEDFVMGTKGVARVQAGRIEPRGGERWRYRGPQPSMYRVEHEELFAAIRSGALINNGQYMCNSTLLALLGRQAAYTGAAVTWDECANGEERLGPTEYVWGDVPEPKVAIPGKTKIA
jgi:predicted dehydrogenase